MRDKKEIELVLNQWKISLKYLNELIQITKDENVLKVHLKSKEEIKKNIGLLNWVLKT
jgi:hypothetical protein